MNVKILCTCNDPELIGAAGLVFNSINVGFPEARIQVFQNSDLIPESARSFDLMVPTRKYFLHHEWIESLIQSEKEPFLICDTDIIFWRKFELGRINRPIAGRLIPAFYDRFTKATTMPRLHTSLMYIDPVRVRREISAIHQWINPGRFNPIINPFYPVQIPGKSEDIFFDTCALLYRAIGGQEFSEEQLDCYDHLNAGTWIKELDKAYPDLSMPEKHQAILKNPELARGIWKSQNEFYANSRPPSIG